MHKFGISFFWALAACILWQGSFAEDQSGYICLIENPKQNQCDSVCLTELSPRLSEIVKAKNQGNTKTRESDNEIKSKLETLEVKGVEAKLERQLQVQTKLEGQQTKMEAKLEESLMVLTNLKDSQAKLEGSLLAVQKNIENQLQLVVNQLQAVSNKIDAKVGVPALVTIAIPFGFERIGSRYFRIVEEEDSNWETAERRCREMGGYLASFRNKEEFDAILDKIRKDKWYWIGINDRKNEGHFVSVASDKPAQFFKWSTGEPNDENHEQNCVVLHNGCSNFSQKFATQ
ncbi:accessory gland protein Acp29AB-like [Drosophila kikkawai]|uniref:Accessory gland protein Acp29AB-like n=1 Tax=Drosophila kikkawai TaxID=30033 RepID=A0ABM4GA80_DROKI